MGKLEGFLDQGHRTFCSFRGGDCICGYDEAVADLKLIRIEIENLKAESIRLRAENAMAPTATTAPPCSANPFYAVGRSAIDLEILRAQQQYMKKLLGYPV